MKLSSIVPVVLISFLLEDGVQKIGNEEVGDLIFKVQQSFTYRSSAVALLSFNAVL